jgi:hypothetical protein
MTKAMLGKIMPFGIFGDCNVKIAISNKGRRKIAFDSTKTYLLKTKIGINTIDATKNCGTHRNLVICL